MQFHIFCRLNFLRASLLKANVMTNVDTKIKQRKRSRSETVNGKFSNQNNTAKNSRSLEVAVIIFQKLFYCFIIFNKKLIN